MSSSLCNWCGVLRGSLWYSCCRAVLLSASLCNTLCAAVCISVSNTVLQWLQCCAMLWYSVCITVLHCLQFCAALCAGRLWALCKSVLSLCVVLCFDLQQCAVLYWTVCTGLCCSCALFCVWHAVSRNHGLSTPPPTTNHFLQKLPAAAATAPGCSEKPLGSPPVSSIPCSRDCMAGLTDCHAKIKVRHSFLLHEIFHGGCSSSCCWTLLCFSWSPSYPLTHTPENWPLCDPPPLSTVSSVRVGTLTRADVMVACSLYLFHTHSPDSTPQRAKFAVGIFALLLHTALFCFRRTVWYWPKNRLQDSGTKKYFIARFTFNYMTWQ
jgi:hypothetical protein